MLDASVFAARRRRLHDLVPGPVLLMGHGARARNLPMNALPFRQDSTFLYFTGCDVPGAAALLLGERCILFLPTPDADDVLWHGPSPTPRDLGARLGVSEVEPVETLRDATSGLHELMTLAVADDRANRLASEITGAPLSFGRDYGHPELVRAVIALRRTKSEVEVAELRKAATHTAAAHRAVMRATQVGGSERGLFALWQGVLVSRGCVEAYDAILTQRGEILHNHAHDGHLTDGALLLLDGGAEVPSGYCSDVTRTWPVNGLFTARQRAAYEAVLEAQLAAIAACEPGVRFREVHDAASLVLARFLADEGLLRVSPEQAVERGAHALFFPHGVGHHLGLDVHDLENFGDLPSYPDGQPRPQAFGTRNLRLDLPLEDHWVVTVEPGFYVVPAILSDDTLRARFADAVDFDRAQDWVGFGGIRIEDDVLVTHDGPEVLTASIPKSVTEIEALVGSGPPPEERLC